MPAHWREQNCKRTCGFCA
ncbi:MAG TPA: hypothetical protein DCS07_11300 [Bdellovibrionales bacterium]|nr:hypothetical protein [Bdellovibrionales bacterium]HCM39408.1 hypothetical protein [Bdellovibrionales bacterium]